MKEGLYQINFKTPGGGPGAGVIVLENGTIRGGDSMLFYRGTFSESGDKFTAHVVTGKHTTIPGMNSVFGRDIVTITLSGTTSADSKAIIKGSAKEVPNVSFDATLSFIA